MDISCHRSHTESYVPKPSGSHPPSLHQGECGWMRPAKSPALMDPRMYDHANTDGIRWSRDGVE